MGNHVRIPCIYIPLYSDGFAAGRDEKIAQWKKKQELSLMLGRELDTYSQLHFSCFTGTKLLQPQAKFWQVANINPPQKDKSLGTKDLSLILSPVYPQFWWLISSLSVILLGLQIIYAFGSIFRFGGKHILHWLVKYPLIVKHGWLEISL